MRYHHPTETEVAEVLRRAPADQPAALRPAKQHVRPQDEAARLPVDILFVVDDSGSMAEEQNNLAANFPQFVSVLEDYRNADGDAISWQFLGVADRALVSTYFR